VNFTLTTPALLFPAISLLLLAYTNRFLSLANLVRNLYDRYRKEPQEKLLIQIHNLNVRIKIIRSMQLLGVLSFFLCVFTMGLLFFEFTLFGEIAFAVSLLLLLLSLALSARELWISADALEVQLNEISELH
jgi:hypothetical protein